MQRWNWQQDDWPHFTWERGKYDNISENFANDATSLADAYQSLKGEPGHVLLAEVLTEEAFHTSDIEGERLDRDMVRLSILKEFGSAQKTASIPRAEEGIGQLMHDLYQNFDDELSHELLHKWHQMLMGGSQHISDIGRYRTHEDAMQVVSSKGNGLRVHFEAPPSDCVKHEMDSFILWYNETLRDGTLSALEHAALTHHHFVMIHPFEDGNGRIGRALTLKSLSAVLGVQQFITLSQAINGTRKRYYAALEACNQSNEIAPWVDYFTEAASLAQKQTGALFNFVTQRSKFYERYRGQLNERQNIVVERIFKEGPTGFKGGLSKRNYIRISKASNQIAESDLSDLVYRGVMKKTGEHDSSRYYLNLEPGPLCGNSRAGQLVSMS